MSTEIDALNDLFSEANETGELSGVKLAEFSNLDQEELQSFKKVFSTLPENIRLSIIKKLVELAEDNVELNFDGIFKHGLNDTNPDIRNQSIEGLWENEETVLINPLLKLLSTDSSDRVRATAATALGRYILLAEQGKLRVSQLDKIRDTLLITIKDLSITEEIRRRALEAISPLCIPEVQMEITTAYQSQNPRLIVSALFAMGRNCDPSWMPILLDELGNTEPEIRFEAATALGEIGDELAVTPLIKIGGDPDTEVRMAVIQSLGKIGGTKAKEYLQNLISSRDTAIRDYARQSLNELKANEDPFSPQF
jgi:HEAT repeat protein